MDYWTLLTCFGSCFLSSTIIPFPSEATVLFCLTQNQNPVLILIIATLGNSLGGATNYYIGQFSRNRWMKKTSPKAEQLVLKYGSYAALLAWLPIIGDPLMLALGIYRTKKIPTFIFMTLGKFLRYFVLVILFCFSI
jgi:membrane protein YqaA with SNARE-associated domain